MSIEIRRASALDRAAMARMLELYQHDLSDIWDQDLDARGEYGYALDRYWHDAQCHPFVVTVAGCYAGFALVDGAVKVGGDGRWIDQFFVLRKYRRTGVGSALALRLFAELPGQWEIGQMTANGPARSFWRKVIGEVATGGFVEHELAGGWWEGHVQCFSVTAPGT